MKTTIYAAYHRLAPRLNGSSIVPIHVGRATSEPLPHMIGDDTGETISERNDAWCELTALYWAWKNDHDSDVIGLMHYRRVLDLTDKHPTGAAEHQVRRFDVESWGAEADSWLAKSVGEFDVIAPRLHTMGRTVEQNYASRHDPQDWEIMCAILKRDHPEYAPHLDAVARGFEIRLGNMAIMSRPVFEGYCTWLFDILFKVEQADLDRSHYSIDQGRYLGFLAERLLTVFLRHLAETQPDLRLREVSILNLSDSLVTPYLAELDTPPADTVNIALSSDRAYLPHAAAMLRSLMDHADPERPINIFFLHSGIEAEDLATLGMMLRTRPKTAFHPLTSAGWFNKSYRSRSRAPSNATYNRFLLFSLLPGLDRLLYLDADMIVKADVCALYDADIGEAQIAAVPDWIMTRTLTGPVPTIDPTVPDLAAYHRKKLGLSDPQIARYFNAGVLLFNFTAMDDPKASGDALMEDARTGRYLFRDQDILNRAFKDSLFSLDGRWNVFNSTDASYGKVPKDNHRRAMEARRDPWILHFADHAYKPWNDATVPHADAYWSTLIRTPFYGEVVRRSKLRSITSRVNWKKTISKIGRATADKVPILRGPLLRIYAWTRKGR